MASVLRLFAVLPFIFWTAPATADNWPSPSTEIYFSPNKKVRLTVIPHASARWGFASEDEARQHLLGPDGITQQANPRGLLERMSEAGWKVVWDRPLLNEVAPTNTLVANSGRYVVTFGNWYGQGAGQKHAVVIYGPDSSVVRSFSLEDLLPADYVKALPQSIMGAMDWQGGEHHLSADEETLILKVLVPSQDERGRDHVDVAIDLVTGQPLPPRGEIWQQVLSEASRIAADRRAAEAAAATAWIAPLVGPDALRTEDWHGYLEEAFNRIDPDWQVDYPNKQVLFPPKARNYTRSEARLRAALLENLYSNVVMIASPAAPDNLVKVLTKIGRKAAPGALKQRRIYVAIGKAYHERVTAALAPTGATVILLDPVQPIPQRQERLAMMDD